MRINVEATPQLVAAIVAATAVPGSSRTGWAGWIEQPIGHRRQVEGLGWVEVVDKDDYSEYSREIVFAVEAGAEKAYYRICADVDSYDGVDWDSAGVQQVRPKPVQKVTYEPVK